MIKDEIKVALDKAVADLRFGPVFIELTLGDNPQFGDYSTNIPLQLTKQEKGSEYQSGRSIANDLVGVLTSPASVERVEIAGPGFINFFIRPEALAKELLLISEDFARNNIGKGKKIVLEHTSVNPNKAMHLGHLRNALLGDSLQRVLKKNGYQVEVQNYIDNTGVQVADTYIGFKYLVEPGLFRKQSEGESFDDYCWELYAEVNRKYQEDPEFKQHQKHVLHSIEDQNSEVAREAKELAVKIVKDTEHTLTQRFGIYHDLYVWESDILNTGLWSAAFELLKKTSGFEQETTGKNAGTWLVRYDNRKDQRAEIPEDEHELDKIFVRSDGTTTYIAKDFAYNMWKFGLLESDFLYKEWSEINGHQVFTTAPDGEPHQNFGKGDFVYTLIDERQSYLQQVIAEIFERLGFTGQAENLHHVAYGVVSLSPETAKALGVVVADEAKKSYAMAGRKGIGVEVKSLHALVTEGVISAKKDKIAGDREKSQVDPEIIAAAAIKYFILKYNSNTEIVFDFKAALSITGQTGPYLQYTYARVCGILEKAKAMQWTEFTYEPNTEEQTLIKLMLEWPKILKDTAEAREPSMVANFAYQLASSFNQFYEKNRVLGIEEVNTQVFRLALVRKIKLVLSDVLDTLGIDAPARM